MKKYNYYKYINKSKTLVSKSEFKKNFTFKNYKEFCKDFRLKESEFKSLNAFKLYSLGRYEILFSLI